MSNRPHIRTIQGTTPGLLDPTQPARVHRISGSTLSFASFHPLTATPRTQSLENLSLNDEPSRPKRIVVETTPGPQGTSSWRFVPRARLGPGVKDEGSWPRLVNICGEDLYCSQDQWDIYKLDSTEYECSVPADPEIPTVTRKNGKDRILVDEAERHPVNGTSAPKSKRRLSTPSDDGAPPNPHKRFRSAAPDDDTMSELGSDAAHPIPIIDDEENEVEDLLGDSSQGSSHAPGIRKTTSRTRPRRRTREETESQRQHRREKIASRIRPIYEDLQEIDMIDLTTDIFNKGHSKSVPLSTAVKRKISPEPGVRTPNKSADSRSNSSDYTQSQPRKRYRTVSPGATKQELDAKRAERERHRAETYKARSDSKRAAWHNTFFQNLMYDIPEELRNGAHTHESEQPPDPSDQTQQPEGQVDPEEARRQAAIEESRRKLAELEKDKPLWEQAARRRTEAERAENEQRRAQREAQRRAAEAEEQRRQQQERDRAEAERRARAAHEKAAREQEQRRRQQQQRWAYGPWTTQRALERYKVLSEAFDGTRFSEDSPASFDAIPWPVLQAPSLLVVEDIDWNAVEAFFRSVRAYMRPQDYKVFVQESHRRFHPDRWRARGILRSVSDEETRSCLEVASNTVAQALTPLWREVVKGG
ncbi:hypothetical protein C8Q72DRAFT_885671 [Fomitopsis betulina]|nr:hypothetical protein C8Q72DRAFT_885671 [Fomitopsis betulina]